jgi:hypothetical protein
MSFFTRSTPFRLCAPRISVVLIISDDFFNTRLSCGGSAGGGSGKDTAVPVGAIPAQNLRIFSTASQNAFFRLYIKAAISPTIPAHNDYADTLTFVATGTY